MSTHPALRETAHRPWPLPTEPWVWRQVWHDLAFLHWPVAPSVIRDRVPKALTIDEYEGQAWLAVTPFWMSGVTLRGLPALPGLSSFPELNVRTYVRYDDHPGVWFFSLDADTRLGVLGGRWLFDLPYHYASMRARRIGSRVQYSLQRPSGSKFVGSYEPISPVRRSEPATLEHFLTERYCLYAQSSGGTLYRAEIHHVPWPLQRAQVELERNDMLAVQQLSVDGDPLVHYAERLEVVIWPLRRAVAMPR